MSVQRERDKRIFAEGVEHGRKKYGIDRMLLDELFTFFAARDEAGIPWAKDFRQRLAAHKKKVSE